MVPFAAAGAKMKIDPTPQKEKVLKLNVNPYTPPTSTGATSHGYPLEMKVAVENASRYLMEFSTEEALGHGSFGKVDLAKNRLDGWSYAIKRLQYKPSKSSVALDTVMNEIFMLASLSHPHIVRYYSAWIDEAKEEGGDSEVCIQTEFCFGGSLSKWWKKWLAQPGLSEVTKPSRFQQTTQTRLHHQPRFHHPSNNVHLQAPYGFGPAVPQVDEAHRAEAVQRIESKLCEILRHICKALQYLHQEKFVVHLDVKPDNILVQQDTLDLETATFKLGDFGSMRKIPANEPAESPRSHMAGVFSGSPILATESASKGSKPGFGGTPFASSGFAAALATPSFKGQQANNTNTNTTSGPSSIHTSPVQNLFHAGQEAPTTPTSSAPSSAATTPVLSRREGHGPSAGQFTPPQLQFHSMNGVLATPSRNLLTPAAVMAHTIESDDIEEGDGRYLAPEFLAESGGLIHTALLPLADIYALGCSIVELAHAALGSGNDVVLPGCFSPAFRELVECMMAPQPANRPSATQLLQHELLLAPEIFQMRMEMEMMRERMTMMERQIQHLQQQQQGPGFLSASHRNLSAPLRCSQTSLNFPPSNGFAGTYSSHGSFGKTSGQTSWARRDIAENRGN
jgi:serine/threonine protein kinase